MTMTSHVKVKKVILFLTFLLLRPTTNIFGMFMYILGYDRVSHINMKSL